MTTIPFTKGWHRVGTSSYAYLVPIGTWGQVNAGFVKSGTHGLLIDTLLTLPHARAMLEELRALAPGTEIETVVNTHCHGDHIWGNQLFADATIISTKTALDEINGEAGPAQLAELVEHARLGELGQVGDWLVSTFGTYDFGGIEVVAPGRTFSGEFELAVGEVEVRLIEVGPAHTLGDLIVYLPEERIAFLGDVVNIGGHAVIWKGALSDSIRACDRILDLALDTVVVGHGPIGDKTDVERFRSYLVYLDEQARLRYEAGLSLADAMADIPLSDFSDLYEPERLAITIGAAYRSFGWPALSDHLDPYRAVAELQAIYSKRHPLEGAP